MRSTSRLATVIWWPKLRRITSAQDSEARMRSRMTEMLAPIFAMCSANCGAVILLRSAMPLMMRSTSSSAVTTLSFLASCSFRRSSISSSSACLRAVGTYSFSICALMLPTNSPCSCLTRACCSASDLGGLACSRFMAKALNCSFMLGAFNFACSLLLHVRRAEHRQRHALLDLVAGDRLVVDEGDDRLDGAAGGSPPGSPWRFGCAW